MDKIYTYFVCLSDIYFWLSFYAPHAVQYFAYGLKFSQFNFHLKYIYEQQEQ
jgi:hypothetical protein